MEKLIAKYTALKADCDKQIKATGYLHEREYLHGRSALYKEFLADLEAKHRNCSCRTGLKWNEAEHDELLTDREKIFKED